VSGNQLPPLEHFFSTSRLVRAVSQERTKMSDAAHTEQFFRRLVETRESATPEAPDIARFVPSRRYWSRPPRHVRADRKPNAAAILHHTMMRLREESSGPSDIDWIRAQDELFTSIRRRALSFASQLELAPPTLRAKLKSPGRSRNEYRVLAVYSLEDKLLMGAVASYLRTWFDRIFYPSSYAFRVSRDGSPPPTHHDAFRDIARFRTEVAEDELWVAECDIQGFFDCVCHETAMRVFDQGVNELESKVGVHVDSRARDVLQAYLRSYSYLGYARPSALTEIRKKDVLADIRDRRDTVSRLHEEVVDTKIGVPQGGALSCFLANLLLNEADRAVLALPSVSEKQVQYLRYCDDIVILATSQDAAGLALATYSSALKDLKLAAHEPRECTYGRKFWSGKSKKPYQWRDRRNGEAGIHDVPWLAFVGYHLRHDGNVRIRPSSIKKELAKQREIADLMIRYTSVSRGALRRSQKRIVASLEARLVARIVGRIPGWFLEPSTSLQCWSAGYRALRPDEQQYNQPVLQTQLRTLDRGMRRELNRVRQVLRFVARKQKIKTSPEVTRLRRRPKYFGRPRSYSGQF
jgi:hypothetical protein